MSAIDCSVPLDSGSSGRSSYEVSGAAEVPEADPTAIFDGLSADTAGHADMMENDGHLHHSMCSHNCTVSSMTGAQSLCPMLGGLRLKIAVRAARKWRRRMGFRGWVSVVRGRQNVLTALGDYDFISSIRSFTRDW